MKILEVGVGRHNRIYPNSMNLDNYEDATYTCDITERTPIDSDSIDIIDTRHTLEHILPDKLDSAMMEMWRILKPNGTLTVIVPHYSSRHYYSTHQHVSPFSSMTLLHWTGGMLRRRDCFRQTKVILRWKALSQNKSYKGWMGDIIDFFANLNISLCERVWLYWVGGFEEIEFEMVKK